MRIVLIALGVLVLVAGGACSAVGLFVATEVDDDGYFRSGTEQVGTETHALAGPVAELGDESPAGRDLGVDVKVQVRGEGAEAVFLGIGPAAQVDDYLEGVEQEVVEDFSVEPFELTTRRVDGNQVPGPPAEQSFWVASATGEGRQVLEWDVQEGDYRLVLMNADGSRSVAFAGEFGVQIPNMRAIAWSVFGGGIAVASLGLFLVVWNVLRIGRGRSQPTVVEVPEPGRAEANR